MTTRAVWNRQALYTTLPGCSVGPIFQDTVKRTLVFYASCDPFATGAYGGHLFAMRPDGTRLRQLTATRGLNEDPDGVVSVELPGPFAYSARDGGR